MPLKKSAKRLKCEGALANLIPFCLSHNFRYSSGYTEVVYQVKATRGISPREVEIFGKEIQTVVSSNQVSFTFRGTTYKASGSVAIGYDDLATSTIKWGELKYLKKPI